MIPEIGPEPVPEPATEPVQVPLQDPLQETKPAISPEVIPEVKPRTRWQKFLHWEFLGLFLIVLTTLIFHISAIDRPPTIVWDEVWYVGDARSIFSGTGEMRPEHPPLAKLFIAAGDYLFNGFKTPEKDSGQQTTSYLDSQSTKAEMTKRPLPGVRFRALGHCLFRICFAFRISDFGFPYFPASRALIFLRRSALVASVGRIPSTIVKP